MSIFLSEHGGARLESSHNTFGLMRSRSQQVVSVVPLINLERRSDAERIAELEARLYAAEDELKRAKQSHEEDSAGFSQGLSKLAHSERALSQTRAKLVDAEARGAALAQQLERALAELATVKADAERNAAAALQQDERRAAELAELRGLAESLSRDSAAGADECARLAEALREAEARERAALIAAEEARDDRAALQAEVDALKVRSASSLAGEERLAGLQERLDLLTHERSRLLELLASLDVLGREITHLTTQANPTSVALPQVESWLGRDVEAEHVRATLRPKAATNE